MEEHQINLTIKDKLVKNVIENFANRSNVGVEKYGTNLERTDLGVKEWLTHLQEELMDAVNYIEALKNNLNK